MEGMGGKNEMKCVVVARNEQGKDLEMRKGGGGGRGREGRGVGRRGKCDVAACHMDFCEVK